MSSVSLPWAGLSATIALVMGIRGYKKKSLSLDGAISAILVGFVTFFASWRFGLILLGFFVSSSKITNYGAKQKKKIEAEFKAGGQRTTIQVVSNSFAATAVSLAWLVRFGTSASTSDAWANASLGAGTSFATVALAAVVGHYACCCGDTWASELGTLATGKPRFILNPARLVPTGTNGGVSAVGLAASLAGGAFIGVVTVIPDAVDWVMGRVPAPAVLAALARWVGVGAACGLAGSLVDSVLGATLQYSGLDHASGMVVSSPPGSANSGSNGKGHHGNDSSSSSSSSSKGSRKGGRSSASAPVSAAGGATSPSGGHTWISGVDLLDNHMVNLLSSLLTSLVAAAFASKAFA